MGGLIRCQAIRGALVLVVACLLSVACKSRKGEEVKTYRVALRAIPESFDPRRNAINIYHYIHLQMYFPLFYYENDRLNSHFLDMAKTQALDDQFKTFQMCLKNGVKYSDGSSISSDDLRASLLETHQVKLGLWPVESIKTHGLCAEVRLSHGDSRYFDKLTHLNSTILKPEASKVGLGPYRVSSADAKKIVLVANADYVKGDFKKVVFEKVNPEEERDVFFRFDDWNYLWHHFDINEIVPDRIKKSWTGVRRPLVKALFLLVDIDKISHRKRLVKCFDRQAFSGALGLDLLPIEGYLPRGLPGSDASFQSILENTEDIDCQKAADVRYPYIHFHPTKTNQTKKFIEDRPSLGLNFENKTVNEAIWSVYHERNKVMLIMADSSEFTPEGFFSFFVSEPAIIGQRIDQLKKKIILAARDSDAHSQSEKFREVHRALLSQYFVIPLGQLKSTIYYKRDIKGISFADYSLGFPRIDRIEVVR